MKFEVDLTVSKQITRSGLTSSEAAVRLRAATAPMRCSNSSLHSSVWPGHLSSSVLQQDRASSATLSLFAAGTGAAGASEWSPVRRTNLVRKDYLCLLKGSNTKGSLLKESQVHIPYLLCF
jgi:hypothetical protein